jgi:hypothetical protein
MPGAGPAYIRFLRFDSGGSSEGYPARRHLVRIGGAQDQRTALPRLLMQQPDRIALRVVGAERVGAHQLGEPGPDMRLGAAHRPHLVQHDRHPGARELPRCLAAGQPAADHMDGVHAGKLPLRIRFFKPQGEERSVFRQLLRPIDFSEEFAPFFRPTSRLAAGLFPSLREAGVHRVGAGFWIKGEPIIWRRPLLAAVHPFRHGTYKSVVSLNSATAAFIQVRNRDRLFRHNEI